jgi:hypothetical protein
LHDGFIVENYDLRTQLERKAENQHSNCRDNSINLDEWHGIVPDLCYDQALDFYQHIGFSVTGRSPVDGQGKPYPLLHMVL